MTVPTVSEHVFRESSTSSSQQLLARACRKNTRRFLVLLAIAYVINQLDRNSIAYAGLTMNRELGLTATQFGWAAGIAILSYCLLEVPSNLFMQRIGARLWLSRIMISWGMIAAATGLVVGPHSLYGLRVLLGAAEAGFFPGVLLYLSVWFPAQYRTRVLAWFLLAIPVSSVIGGPLAGALLQLDGFFYISGWRWLFFAEGAPAVVLGVLTFCLLTDHPRDAAWLTASERSVLLDTLENEPRDRPQFHFSAALKDGRVYALTVIQFGFTLGSYGIGMWMPLILKRHDLTNLQVGLLSAPPYLAASIGMLLWARHVDRSLSRIVPLTLCCLLAVVGLVASVVFSNLVMVLASLTLALVGVTSARTIFWTIPPRFLVGVAAAGGLAFINSIGMLGGFAGPFMVGWLRDLTGSFTVGLLAMGGVLLLTAACAASLRWILRDE
jgi:MFS transporter, ACS family, tartrate transporter